MIQIAVINESTVLKDAEVETAVAALQKQVSGDFAAAWGANAKLNFVERGGKVPKSSWQVGIFDNSDQAGALGYHDLTAAGLPLGKAFAGTDLQNGSSWTVTLSHETLEMLGDPDVNLSALVDDGNERHAWLYAYEVCDAVEADNLGYRVDGVLLSDFVYPAWFEFFRPPRSTPFDHTGALKAPFELAAGGYISVLRVLEPFGWQEITARGERYEQRPPVGSRRERRHLPREHWRRSENRAGSEEKQG